MHAWHTFSLALMDSLLAAFCASAALAFCALAALVASVPELIASSVAFRLSIIANYARSNVLMGRSLHAISDRKKRERNRKGMDFAQRRNE